MRVALRLLTVAAAIFVLAVLALRPQQEPSAATGAVGSLVRVPASPLTLVCPAAPQAQELPAGTDPQFATTGPPPQTRTWAVSYARPSAADSPDTLQLRTLPVTGDPVLTDGRAETRIATASEGSGDAVAVRATPTGDLPAGSVAVTSTMAASGDLAGLAVAECAPAGREGYLVGGGVGPGRNARVLISNPGRTVVTVDLDVYTDQGVLQPGSGRGVSIAPGTTRGFSLDALAPQAQLTAVGYRATGGVVGGALVDNVLHGLVPRGIETVTPSTAEEHHVLTPVVGPANLRLANPGERELTARWRAGTAQGPGTWSEGVQVPAGGVVDVAVPDQGTYSLTVDGDRRFLAAASFVQERPTPDKDSPAADLAWAGSAPALADQGRLAVPGGSNVLVLAAESPASVTVRQLDAEGVPIGNDSQVAVPAGAVRTVDVDPSAVTLWMDVTSGPVHAGLLSRRGPAGAFVAASSVRAPGQGQEMTGVVVGSRP